MAKHNTGVCRACGYTGTKASMTRHLATCAERPRGGKHERDSFRLRVGGGGPYWLDLEAAADATLNDLDGFLRGVWLECCGHLSEFDIGPETDWDEDSFAPPKQQTPQPTLGQLLQVGQRFGYVYDFGSSTELSLTVQAREPSAAREAVVLLARNLPPAYPCAKCGQPTEWIHTWEFDEASGMPTMHCDACADDDAMDEGAYLPLVNSPRTGVCAYEGGSLDDWPPGASPTA